MSSIGASAAWVPVSSGDIVPADGYYGDEETGRETLEATRARRLERDAWQQAVLAISDDLTKTQSTLGVQLAALDQALEAERQEREKALKAANKRTVAMTVLGIVVGGVIGCIAAN